MKLQTEILKLHSGVYGESQAKHFQSQQLVRRPIIKIQCDEVQKHHRLYEEPPWGIEEQAIP